MSIADKLQAIAENEQKVFDAGKIALLKASNYMNAAASGKVIAVGDVSPVEHDVAVTLSSGSVTDFSSVTVKRYGKNLFENNTDELYTITFINRNGSEKRHIGYAIRLPAGTYTQHAVSTVGEFENLFIYTTANTLDGEFIFSDYNTHLVVDNAAQTATFTVDEDFIYYVYNASATLNVQAAVTLLKSFEIQLEVGDTATPFEPYVEPTIHVANADGTVEGVKSLSPSMTLVTDTDGVTIDCSYLRDIDTYIDSLIGGE